MSLKLLDRRQNDFRLQDSPAPSQSRSISDSVVGPPWLSRLWANQRLHLRPKTAHGWGVHISRFLHSVCSEQVEGPVDILAKRFLEELAIGPSPPSNWQLDQVRQALDVFARGMRSYLLGYDDEWSPIRNYGDTRRRGVEKFLPNPQLPLREQLREVIRLRRYSPRTEEAYWHWVARLLRYHRRPDRRWVLAWRHPREIGAVEVQAFLTHLAAGLNVSAWTHIDTHVLARPGIGVRSPLDSWGLAAGRERKGNGELPGALRARRFAGIANHGGRCLDWALARATSVSSGV